MKKPDLKTLLINWWLVISKLGNKLKLLSNYPAKNRVAIVVAIGLLLLLGVFLVPRLYKNLYDWWKHRKPTEIKAFGITMPLHYKIHGIDISKHQGEINWHKVKTMEDQNIRLKFVFMKATEGVSLKDATFDYNWAAARQQKLARGAYHFYRTRVFSGDQAKHFIRHVHLRKGDLPPVLDIEDLDGVQPEIMRKGIKNWLTLVENHYKITPIIYTNKDFWKKNLNTPDLKKYRLWIAHYHTDELRLSQRWLFWQHSDRGAVNGIGEKVDFNVFCCDTSAFKMTLIR